MLRPASMTPLTTDQLARALVDEFAGSGFSDELLKLSWKVTNYLDFVGEFLRLDSDAFDAFDKARQRFRPPGTLPTMTPWAEDERPEIQPLVPTVTLPPWPIHVLPDWMAQHIENMANQLQVPVDLCAQLSLGALAAAAMGHAEVAIGPKWRESLNLYLATAMHSGAGKSPAEKAMTKPLREWEAQRMDEARPRVIEAERTKALKERKAKAAEDAAVRGGVEEERLAAEAWMDAATYEVPKLPRLLADDATPEALVQLLSRHEGRIALLSTEADMLDMAAGAYADGKRPVNLSVYLKGWSGDSIIVDRKGSNSKAGDELRIPEPLLTVSLTMQPTVIDWLRASGGQLEGRGLLARFMFAVPESRRGFRDRTMVLSNHVETGHRYHEEFVALADRWSGWSKVQLPFSERAANYFVAWIGTLEPQLVEGQRLAPVAEWVSKLQSSVARLAGLLHLCSDPDDLEIGVGTVMRAIEVGKYWIDHAIAMAVVTEDDAIAVAADLVLGWIGRKRPESFTPRDVWMPMRRQFQQVVDMVPALQELVACGYLRLVEGEWDKVGLRGASVRFSVHPDVLAVRDVTLTWRGICAENARKVHAPLEVKKEITHPSADPRTPLPDARALCARSFPQADLSDPARFARVLVDDEPSLDDAL